MTQFAAPEAAGTFGRRYVFAASDQTEFSATLRADWTFTPNLSLQLYARPFVTRGRYTDYSQPTAPRQLRFPTVEESGGTVTRADDGTATITPGDGGAAFTLQPDFTVPRAPGQRRAAAGSTAPAARSSSSGSSSARVSTRPATSNSAATSAASPRTSSPTCFLLKLTYWLG